MTINTWPGWKNVRVLSKNEEGCVYEIRKDEFGRIYKAALKVISVPSNELEYHRILAQTKDVKACEEYFYNQVKEYTEEFSLLSELKGITNIMSYEDHIIQQKQDSFGWDILIRMEILTPLKDYLYSHSLSQEDICKLGIDMCKALEVCDKKNIIHSDIRPENIFVNKYGNFKLGNFKRHHNEKDSSFATFSYQAPEVYLNKSFEKNIDLYSLGLVLCQLLNRDTSFSCSNTVNSIQSVIWRGNKPSFENMNSRFTKILLKSIEGDCTKRYQSATEFKKDLEDYLAQRENNGLEMLRKDPLFILPVSKKEKQFVLKHVQTNREFPILKEKSLKIGRGRDNDIVLVSKFVSKNHAELTIVNNACYVIDLKAVNKVKINGQDIPKGLYIQLFHNDRLKIADVEFLFEEK